MHLSRAPGPALRPFVALLWAADAPAPTAIRELALPSGAMNLVLRLGEAPVRVFDEIHDAVGQSIGSAAIGGLRTRPYLRDASAPTPTVGAVLHPGAAEAVLGVAGVELAQAHTPLAALWGDTAVAELRGRLAEASLDRRLNLFEAALVARRPERRDPLIEHAMSRFAAGASVGAVVRESGWSHRHFTTRFRHAVGPSPRDYRHVARFGRVLRRLMVQPNVGLAELALAQGYADQPHLTRDFRAFSGLSPGRYRALAPASPWHVPVRRSNSFKTPPT